MDVYTGLQKIFADYPAADPKDLLAILGDIQQHLGYLSEEALLATATFLQLPELKVLEIAQTNTAFKFMPQGRHHIKVCCGTACHLKDGQSILKKITETLAIEPGQKTSDGVFSLEITTCRNICKFGPLVDIDHEVYLKSTPDSIVKVIDKLKKRD